MLKGSPFHYFFTFLPAPRTPSARSIVASSAEINYTGKGAPFAGDTAYHGSCGLAYYCDTSCRTVSTEKAPTLDGLVEVSK